MKEKTIVPIETNDKEKEKLLTGRRWDPWTMFEEIWPEFDFDLERFPIGRPHFPRLRFRGMEPVQTWRPDIDVFQKQGKLIVKADLPGMEKKDIEILIEKGNLLIRGQRIEETKIEEDDFFRAERNYGSFFRSIPLPSEIEDDAITAKFTNGVLEVMVTLPETVMPEPKRIEIG